MSLAGKSLEIKRPTAGRVRPRRSKIGSTKKQSVRIVTLFNEGGHLGSKPASRASARDSSSGAVSKIRNDYRRQVKDALWRICDATADFPQPLFLPRSFGDQSNSFRSDVPLGRLVTMTLLSALV
jgi:hypothetical protein